MLEPCGPPPHSSMTLYFLLEISSFLCRFWAGKTQKGCNRFFFAKFCLDAKFSKKEGRYEKCYYEPFRRLYAY